MTRTRLTPEERRARARLRSERWRPAHGIGPRTSAQRPWLELGMNHVYVAGSINMDVVATAARYPKIGETVSGREIFFFPGGKGANQAVSAAKLGASTTLIGCLEEDAFGRQLSTFLSSQGVDLTYVRHSTELHTGTSSQ